MVRIFCGYLYPSILILIPLLSAEAMSAEGQPDHNVRARKRGRMPSDPSPPPTIYLAPVASAPQRRRKGGKGRKDITDLPTDLLLEVCLEPLLHNLTLANA